MMKPEAAEISYTGLFERASFGLLTSSAAVLDALLARLRRYGAQPANFKIETGPQSPAQTMLVSFLPQLGGTVKVGVEGVEVWLDGSRDSSLPDVAEDALAAIQEASAGTAFASHTVVLAIHGRLHDDLTVSGWMAESISSRIAGFDISGVRLVGSPGPEATAQIVAEPSQRIAGGIFVSVSSRFPGTTTPRGACVAAAAYSSEVLRRLKLAGD